MKLLKLLLSPYTIALLFAGIAFEVLHFISFGASWQPPVIALTALAVLMMSVLRIVVYTVRLPRAVRYFPRRMPGRDRKDCSMPAELALALLEGEGYAFQESEGGIQGERRDRGYYGTIILHIGLVALILTGIYNFFNQFQGVLLVGGRQTTFDLRDKEQYDVVERGLLTSQAGVGFKFLATEIHNPGEEWPDGAVEYQILDDDDDVIREGTLHPGEFIDVKGYRFSMPGMFYQVLAAFHRVDDDKKELIYAGMIPLRPDKEKAEDGFLYYTNWDNKQVGLFIEILFNPKQQRVRAHISRGGEPLETLELGMGEERFQRKGGYQGLFDAYRRMAEVHVSKNRMLWSLYAGGFLILAGGLLRLWIRPRRVWIEGSGERCLVASTDARVYRVLGEAESGNS